MKCVDFRSENGLMISVLVAELLSKSCFKAVVVSLRHLPLFLMDFLCSRGGIGVSSMSVTTTVKEKTTPNFSPSFFLIGSKPLFSSFTPSFTEKEVHKPLLLCLLRVLKGRK